MGLFFMAQFYNLAATMAPFLSCESTIDVVLMFEYRSPIFNHPQRDSLRKTSSVRGRPAAHSQPIPELPLQLSSKS